MKTLLFMLTELTLAGSPAFAQNSAQKTDQSNSAEQTVLKTSCVTSFQEALFHRAAGRPGLASLNPRA
jgi:hypothetical protein